MSERTFVTGFGPFLDVADNPSRALASTCGRPHEILEVSYDAVEDFIFHFDPSSFERLLLLGVAPSRDHLCAELFARNTYGAAADVRGKVRSGLIQLDQPLLLASSLFCEDALANVMVRNPQVRISLDAGSYLCNFAYFKALSAFPTKRVGFLHVPSLERMSLDTQLENLLDLLDAIETSPTPELRAG